MQYKSEFKSLRGDTIKIAITTKATGEDVELILSGKDPVIIDYKADDVFKPLKMSGCSVCVLTKQPLLDLYTGTLNDVTLHVYRNNTLLWFGFLTPNVYTSGYKDVYDELTLEFVDPLSAMENVKFAKFDTDTFFATFQQYITQALSVVGASSVITKIVGIPDDLSNVGAMQRNYIDETDDANDGAMTWQEVMESIFRYMNRTACIVGDTLYIYDVIETTGKTAIALSTVGIAEGNGSISMGNVYNKVTVVENTNPLKDVLASEALDEDNMTSGMLQTLDSPYFDDEIQAYNVKVQYSNWYSDIRAIYFPKQDSGWWLNGSGVIMATRTATSKRLAHDNGAVVNSSYQKLSKGAFFMFDSNYEQKSIPVKLSFKKSIVMFLDNEGKMLNDQSSLQSEPFVKYHKTDNPVVLRKGYLILSLTYKYLPCPMTQLEESKEDFYYNPNTYDFVNNANNMGFSLDTNGRDYFKAKLRIGNKYWNGEAWTSVESTFQICHTWKGTEKLFGSDASIDNTNTYKLKLGENVEGLAIPIGDNSLFGDVYFELCPPSYFSKTAFTMAYSVACCMISNLSLCYSTQLASNESLVLSTEDKDKDIKIVGTANALNILDMDDVKFDTNTWSDKENSYSYVLKKVGASYEYYIPTTIPEKKCISRLLNYYSGARLIYQNVIKDNPGAHLSPMDIMTISTFNGKTFAIGDVSFDLGDNSADVTLMEI